MKKKLCYSKGSLPRYKNGSTTDTTMIEPADPAIQTSDSNKSSNAQKGSAVAGAVVDAIPGIIDAAKMDTKGVDPASEALRKRAKILKMTSTATATAGAAASPWTFGISGIVGGGVAAGINAKAGKLLAKADQMDIRFRKKQEAAQQRNQMMLEQGMGSAAPGLQDTLDTTGKKEGLFKTGSIVKSSLLRGTGSGRIEGKGGPKTDSIKASLNGGMVIPAENVRAFLDSDEAKRLGLSATLRANTNQPGGDQGRVSDGEYYIDQNTVNKAIGMGINLQKYAPNAKEPIGGGSQYQADDGTTMKFKMPAQQPQYTVNTPAAADESGKPVLDNTPLNTSASAGNLNPGKTPLYYRNWEKGLFVDNRENLTEEQKLMNRMRTLANVSTGLKGAGLFGSLIYNARNRFKPVQSEDMPAPAPMNTELDTTDEENNAKALFLAQLHQAKEMGVNPYLFPAGSFQNAMSQIATKKQNYRYQVENQNTGLINNWLTNVVANRNQNRMMNRELGEQHRAQKSAAITSNVEQMLNLPMDFVNQRIALEYYPKYFANLPT